MNREFGSFRFRAWMHGLPCAVAGCTTRDRRPGRTNIIEMAHIRRNGTPLHGIGRRHPWTSTIPLCWRHHDEMDNTLGQAKFARAHRLVINNTEAGSVSRAADLVQEAWNDHEHGLEQ